MKYAADFRAEARAALRGNWPVAILTGLVASLLGGSLIGNGRSSVDFEELSSYLSPENLFRLRPLILGVSGALLLYAILALVIGGAAKLGYARFNLNLADRSGATFSDLFSQFHRLGAGFALNLLTMLYVFLWSLLFVIPGIVKAYSYAMAPYILAEHPELTADEAITHSRTVMQGNKWRLFCLDFSFIGWDLLCSLPVVAATSLMTALLLTSAPSVLSLLLVLPLFPLMVVGYLFLNPYREAAHAVFYREVSGEVTYDLPFDL